MTEQLPTRAIETDHRLERSATNASEALAKHRWHWTLDESNSDRVSFRAYARAVGKHEKTIRTHAKGYADWTAGGAARTLDESIERAKLGTETEAATEAVARARGTTFGHTRSSRPTEVRRVRQVARERAEKHGTSVEDEAPKVADAIVRHERTTDRERAARQEATDLRYVEMEGHLAYAKKRLMQALNLAHQIEWDTDSQELLRDTVANIQALLGLIDTALGGAADVDWDAELAKITS
jgi:hypothetical protein